ncbi:MAG: hypothetical protein M3N13_03510 [Candidatus Eremiobacteraeota bacterium]|nr:hypothetical protein [Candidatus Eremiobacteraeota bacterium]
MRPRLIAALTRHEDTPTRLLIAPAGFGKTTLIRHYLGHLTSAHTYIAFEPDDEGARILERISDALEANLPLEDLDHFIDALERVPAQVLVFDDADFKNSRATDVLLALIEHMPEHLSLIVASRSRGVVAGARALVTGAFVYLNADDLAFTTGEIAQLCDLHGLRYIPADVEKIVRLSDGWPIVVSLGIRTAAIDGHQANTVYESWCAQHAEAFHAFILEEAARSAHGHLLRRLLLSDDMFCAVDEWEALERAGLFVRRRNGRHDLYRVLLDVFSPSAANVAESSKIDALPLVATVLGEFTVTIGGRKVEWVRRKDARIFKYLLLKPGGMATRQELIDVFWPEREHQAAIAALRTTCSNIRHAIREAVGHSRAQLYFVTDLHVRVPSERVISDLQRFRAHAAAVAIAEEQGDAAQARVHLKELTNIERGDFIVDAPCALYDEIVAEIASAFRHVRALRSA